MNASDALQFDNLLKEAQRLGKEGRHEQARPHLMRALRLMGGNLMPLVRPEDDPSRPAADREAWRAARGA